MKTKTIDLKGKEYSQVKERLKQFRTSNPNALIETTPTFQPDDTILFRARILKDKADQQSAEATGHSYGQNKGDKSFEKLESIAVGRALAFMGYAADGEIASSEEMEEFLEYQKEKLEELVHEGEEKMNATTNMDELKTVWATLTVEVKEALTDLKETLKTKYENPKVRAKRGVDERPKGEDNGNEA